MIDAFLGRLGLRPRVFRALLGAYLLMDLRGQHYERATGTSPRALVSPLFWVVSQYLFVGAVAATVLFGRADVFFFAATGLAASMVLIAAAVVVEFNEVVMDLGDLTVLGHRPIDPRTYAAARLSNLLFYVLLLTLASNLFPAIVGAGLRDAGWAYLPAYALTAVCANLTVAGLVILLQGGAMNRAADSPVRDVLAWTQIVMVLVVFYGAQLMLRDAGKGLELFADDPPAWFRWLPSSLLAAPIAEAAAAPRWAHLAGAAAMVAGTAAVCGLAVQRLARGYTETRPERRGGATLPRPAGGRVGGPLLRRLARSREEAAAFWICLTMYRREPDLKLRSIPSLGMVVAAAILGAAGGQIGDPYAGTRGDISMSLVTLYLLASCVPVLIHNFGFSRAPEAAWLLEAAPIARRERFAAGVRKAATHLFALPVLLGLGVLYAVLWKDPLHALLHAAIGWALVEGVAAASMMTVGRGFPGARPLARGESLGAIGIVVGVVSCALSAVAGAHYLALRSPGLSLGFLGVVAAAAWALRRVSDRRLAAVYGRGGAGA